MTYDAIVIGAGHNGLVCACYLAKSGLATLVVERRDVVGGAAVTEEFVPGFKASTASYSLSLFRPGIFQELRLASHGLNVVPKDPQMFVPLQDGRHFFVWRDRTSTIAELDRIHPGEGAAYLRWEAFWDEVTPLLRPLIDDPEPASLDEVEKILASVSHPRAFELAVTGSAAEATEAFFSTDEVCGAFAGQGIVGVNSGVRDPGTAWVATFHRLGGELVGADGTWGYVMGGMGSVTQALASEAIALGVEIRTGAECAEVLIEDGRAAGVKLVDGSSVKAKSVVSNAGPRLTYQHLVPIGALEESFLERIESWRHDGCVVKVSLALSELPDYAVLPGAGPHHLGTLEVSPSLSYLDRAFYDDRRDGISRAPFMEAFIQSAIDPGIAKGGHVVSVFAQYAAQVTPQKWEQLRDTAGDVVVEKLGEIAPNLPSSVIGRLVLGPADLESRFGLTGGDIFHGSMLPEQSFDQRFSYQSPIPGLFLCGSGTHPGGGVMGTAGRNAATAVISTF